MRELLYKIWKLNDGFPIVTAFLLSLGMVWILVGIGCMNFDFVLPYLFLIFFLYGFSGKRGVVGIAGAWCREGEIRHKVIAAAVLLVIGNGLFLEGVLKAEKPAQWIAVTVLFLILYLYIWFVLKECKKVSLYSALGGIVFALFAATGNLTIYEEHGWWGYGSALLGWFCLFTLCLECCFELTVRSSIFCAGPVKEKEQKRKIRRWGAGSFLASFAVDVVFLLAFYPGVMEYDSLKQMEQIWGGEPYSNHHPWLHTMLIKGIYELGVKLCHSTNRAFALYSLFSVSILSFAFACVVAYLAGRGMKRKYLLLLVLVYIASPVNQMYSIVMWKDIPFAVSVLFFTVLLCLMYDRLSEGRTNLTGWILFVPIGFCVCFFRSNGLYVFLGMIPFLIWAFWKQKRSAICAIGIVLALGLLYKGPVFRYFQVTEPDLIESLSIPAQQIAAVISQEGEISDDQKALLSNVIDLEKVPEAYLGSPGCSDAVKELVRDTDNQEFLADHAPDFFRTWLELFWQNKRIYVRAFAEETEGYWYHKTYFPFIWATYIEENGAGIERDSKLPEAVVEGIRSWLEGYKAHFDRYLSIGLYIYIFLACLITALRKKNGNLVAYLPALGIWGTLLIATPVFADLRYAYAIYVSVPFLVCLTMRHGGGGEAGEGKTAV